MKTFCANDFRVLVVDDDPNIIDLIRMYLQNQGFQVSTAHNGNSALSKLQTETIHIVVLDLMMPEMDGWELCQIIQKNHPVPVLMVTARGEMSDKLEGFKLGADDYIVKPFDPNELTARVVSLLRRSYLSQMQIQLSTVRYHDFKIDNQAHEVYIKDKKLELSPREYQLISILTQHPNQVLTRQQLIDLVWGIDFLGEDRAVDVLVKRLRKKIPSNPHYQISTVRGIGYKFEVGDKSC
ncbi:response regulator transcription factor [Alicyclobacillus sp. TC]|uniref:response regulator transcription factor n=1 Tax=Alicyclobacillus sp. TC TaxID=2606450 RepID=UPI001933E89E|nr:response regulator transcription factor [Alicyclobacillus sp. TC]